MQNPLKFANLWRVVRDVDLTALRAAAHTPFRLVVVSETGDDALRLRRLLSGEEGAPHPWIEIAAAATGDVATTTSRPLAAILITRDARLSPVLDGALQRFVAAGAPVLTVVAGDTGPTAATPRPGEAARVVVAAIDQPALEPIAQVLADLAGSDAELALAAQLPPLRRLVFSRTIERASRANASFAFTTGLAETVPLLSAPLYLGDIIVLTKNQLMMCYRIALAAGKDAEPRALMGEIFGVLGGGMLFRQAARSLVGLVPIIGLLPKVAIAYAGTQAIGRAMVAWTTEGRQVTREVVAKYSRESLDKGRAIAERLSHQQPLPAGTSRMARLKAYLPGPRRSA